MYTQFNVIKQRLRNVMSDWAWAAGEVPLDKCRCWAKSLGKADGQMPLSDDMKSDKRNDYTCVTLQ